LQWRIKIWKRLVALPFDLKTDAEIGSRLSNENALLDYSQGDPVEGASNAPSVDGRMDGLSETICAAQRSIGNIFMSDVAEYISE
jgi:hypothetical protein